MPKKTIKNESIVKKSFRITLWLLLGLIGLVIIFIVGTFALSPIFDKFEHDRFITLDNQMQIIYKNLKTAASGSDKWNYDEVCEDKMAGDFPTGQYFCSITISMNKTITSVGELNNLQAKYFPVIDNSKILTKTSDLRLYSPNDFGINFVVSSAFKEYKELKTNIDCKYSTDLYQSTESFDIPYHNSESYGSSIYNNLGNFGMRLKCTDLSNNHWYFYKE